jgi:hypothetical protein
MPCSSILKVTINKTPGVTAVLKGEKMQLFERHAKHCISPSRSPPLLIAAYMAWNGWRHLHGIHRREGGMEYFKIFHVSHTKLGYISGNRMIHQ